MNEAHVSLTGYVATEPRTRAVSEGVQNLSMRVAWTPRWLDRATGEWTDGGTSYATVTCWRKLADNAAVCLRKGDPVLVKGRLSVRSYEDKQGVQRVQVDVDATSIGHDLGRGVAMFRRTRPATGRTAAEAADDELAGGSRDVRDPTGLGDVRDGDGEAGGEGELAGGGIFNEEAIDALAQEAAAVPV
jgi:single-strand DNA-binding protein